MRNFIASPTSIESFTALFFSAWQVWWLRKICCKSDDHNSLVCHSLMCGIMNNFGSKERFYRRIGWSFSIEQDEFSSWLYSWHLCSCFGQIFNIQLSSSRIKSFFVEKIGASAFLVVILQFSSFILMEIKCFILDSSVGRVRLPLLPNFPCHYRVTLGWCWSMII